MRVLFLTNGVHSPSSRFRVEQFFSSFSRRGIQCELRAGYGTAYNRIANTFLGTGYKAACRVKRAAATLGGVRYDVVFLQRTALPNTALPERILSRVQPRIVFDFDDAVYLDKDGLPSHRRENAFLDAVRSSAWIIAGNSHLAQRARAPEKTSVLPTVIDTQRYLPSARRRRGGPIVGWMGSSTNLPSLRRVLPDVLNAVSSFPDALVRIVCNGRLEDYDAHPRVEQIAWSPTTEIPLLQSFDIGLMPLEDNEAARGKCGFKMVQYMAVGAPVVASAVGANADLFNGSNAGHLVVPGGSFEGPVRHLLADEKARRLAGRRARAHAEAHLDIEPIAERYVEIFRRVAAL